MKKRIIIAGGGTGGHIFPAIAIANALKKKNSDIDILFVGAIGKMEMEKVPQAGFRIEGLDIAGFNRSSLIKNIGLPLKLMKSFFQVRRIMNEFKPTAVIGVGGYSSFPVLRYAQAKGIPSFIHESNSFAGKSNIWLGKKATKIFVAVDGMERFFPKDKIVITGNPIRSAIADSVIQRSEALRFFSLDENRKTVLVVGGSLGAKSINEAIGKHLEVLLSAGLQLIWQTGNMYLETAKEKTKGKQGVWVNDFITQMDLAYAASDIVVSRAGAMAVSELAVVKKPAIFIPYPFAAEDHQTVNAMKLVKANAAMMIKDNDALDKTVNAIVELAKDETRQIEMKKNIETFSHKDADEKIADEVLRNIY